MANEKVTKIIKNINDEIKSNGKYMWYMMKDGNAKLIYAGKSKTETKKFIYEKIEKNKKYIGAIFYLISVTTNKKAIDNETFLETGPVAVHLYKYEINKKFKLKDMNKTGIVWFITKFLKKFKFKESYVRILLEKDYNKEINTSMTKRTIFNSEWI